MRSSLYLFLLFVATNSSYALLTTPTLNSPANNSINQATGVRLDVQNSNGTSYVFEYSESSNMTNSTRLEVSTTSSNTRVWLNKLKLNTDYYWRVKAKKTTDSSNWTGIWKFTTDTVIHRLYPGSGVTYEATGLYFSSYRVASFDSIEYQFDTSASFTSAEIRQVYLPDTFQSYYTEMFLDNFLFGTTYYWRIRPHTSSNNGYWSDTGYFSTFDSIVPKSPSSSGTYDVEVEFEWQSGGSTQAFQIQLDTSTSFNSISLIDTFSVDGLRRFTSDPFKVINLMYESTYYYRVRAINEVDSSSWVTRSFTTKSFENDFTRIDAYIDPKESVEVLRKIKGSTGYQIQLDLVNTFNTSNLRNLHTTTGIEEVDTLLFGKTYFVRSRPYHSKDTGNWTKVRTTNVLPFPTTYYPYNNYTNIQLKDSLVFSTRIGIDGFQMQVSIDPTFNSALFLDTTMIGLPIYDDPAVSGHTFKFNTVYYWRMRCWHSADTSVWSTNKKFATVFSPTLLKPVNSNFLGTNVSTKLEWEGLKTVDQYHIMMDTTFGFNSSALLDTIVSGATSFDLEQLYFDQLYYWKVRALTPVDTSAWSDTWNFKTHGVRLTDPKNNITNLSLTSLDWASITGTTGYILELDSNVNFNNPFVVQDTVSNAFFHYFTDLPSIITFNTKYYWRVKLYHQKDTSDWSLVWNFTTKPRRAPSLVSPTNFATAISVVPTLSWDAYSGAASYAIEYGENEDFTNATKVISSSTTKQLVLKASTTYYWHVRGRNSSNQEFYDWSETWQFTTTDGIPAVILTSPADETTDAKTTIALEWEKRDEAESYLVEVSTKSDFSGKQQKSASQNTSQFSSLLYDTTYFWRVRAINGALQGAWSEVWQFSTEQDKSSVSELRKREVIVYPNPAHKFVTLDCQKSVFIPTEIVNVLGESVLLIPNAVPYSTTRVDISDLPIGIYFIKFQNDSNRFSKFLLIE